MPLCGSGGLVCSSYLLIRRAQRARCQAETPPIVLSKIPEPALVIVQAHHSQHFLTLLVDGNEGHGSGRIIVDELVKQPRMPRYLIRAAELPQQLLVALRSYAAPAIHSL